MARITTGSIVTDIRGKLGGTVYSRNRYGTYARVLARPVNPNTTGQGTVRGIFGNLSSRFSTTLTAAERQGWTDYAAATQVTNSNGTPQFITANAMYIRCNAQRVQAGFSPVDTAPLGITSGMSALSITPTIDVSNGNISLAYTTVPDALKAVGSCLSVYMQQPRNPSQVFAGGQYKYVGKIAGATTPPTSPQTLSPLPYTIVAGQVVRLRFVQVMADGRVSSPSEQDVAVVA